MKVTRLKRSLPVFSLTFFVLLLLLVALPIVQASPTPPIALSPALTLQSADPLSVTIAGNLQSELGCSGDWQPECDATKLTHETADDVWQDSFAVPAGSWEYKAALNNSWAENYGAGGIPNGGNVALTLETTTTVKFYYDHKSHWVTDNHNSVIATAVGSFQSELGCPGDWQPECLRSWLQDPDGDGTYTFVTTALPAGDYEGKVALNENWDVSYGVGGDSTPGSANLNFTVPRNNLPVTFSFNAETHIPVISVDTQTDAELATPRLNHGFENEVLYFLIPDRFEDADSTNNCGDYAGECVISDTEANVLTHGYLPSDQGYYHGGDLKGLQDKLPYLKNMGITAIWVGPIFKNNPVQEDTSNLYGHSSGYHGYWITDFYTVDPHLGTNQDFADLVDAAHNMGIKVFMDIITNHTADLIKYAEDTYAYRNKTDYPYKDASGVAFDDSALAFYGQADYNFPALSAEVSFPYTPEFDPAGDSTAKSPDWLDDPTMYHNRGNSQFNSENSLYGDFYGLDDLFTERREVVEGMVDIYAYWINTFGIDGYRIDTTKHVNMEFWQYFGPAILAEAQDEGIDDFFAFGEVYDQQFGPRFLSEFSTRGKLQATIDFGFQMAARDFASQSAPTDELRTFFEGDDFYTDANSNAYAQPTFLGNHDMGRIGYFLQTDNPGVLDAELLARDKLAHALMFFSRGQPVIYYGDEQGFTGDGGDKLARQDMFTSTVGIYNDDNLIGTDATTAQENFIPSHPLYQALLGFSQIYSDNVALRTGAQIYRYSEPNAGVFAFSRIDREEKIEYIVALNNSLDPTDSFSVSTFYPAGTRFVQVSRSPIEKPVHKIYMPIIMKNGTVSKVASVVQAELVTAANGELSITVPGLGFVIYKAEEPIPASDTAPAVTITGPTDGQIVELGTETLDGQKIMQRLGITATVSPAETFAEVTFAIRPTGGTDYTIIGVDDNPPYRVFYHALTITGSVVLPDGSILDPGTPVDIKAIVKDLSTGNVSSDMVSGVIPQTAQETKEGYDHVVLHYLRADGNYDAWGLHFWGDGLDPSETVEWANPRPFLGQDDYGRFTWLKLADDTKQIGFIVHSGDTKDTPNDRFFTPASDGPEIWLKQDDANVYTSQAEAQDYVTIHYTRTDSFDGWGLHLWGDAIDPSEGTGWATPKLPAYFDDYGAVFTISLADATKPVNFLIHNGDTKDTDNDRSFIPTDSATLWLKQGDATNYTQRGAALGFATLHYRRPAGDYGDTTTANDFWGLHTWGDAADPGWSTPRKPTYTDTFGIAFEVPLINNKKEVGYLLHRGDTKDPGPDQTLNVQTWGHEVWQLQAADPEKPYLLPIPRIGGVVPGGDLSKAKAHWLTADTIAWDADYNADYTYSLFYDPTGAITLADGVISGGQSFALTYDAAGLSAELKAKFPHLATFAAFKVPAGQVANVPAILKGQMAVVAQAPAAGKASSRAAADDVVVDATSLQIPGVLDALYAATATTENLGVTYAGAIPSLAVWAPTAKNVTLHLFNNALTTTTSITYAMTASASGVWSVTGDATWTGKYYLYEVEVFAPATGQVEHNLVTDPYAVSLSINSVRSQIINLADAALKPAGWDSITKPELDAPEDITLYELHVRDFSITDTTVAPAHRGTYEAFTEANSNGMKHLKALADAGLTHIHLLPVFDIATINEDKSQWVDPAIPAVFTPTSTAPQAAVAAVADLDGFNWGYDPFHYTVPEGSYSTDPADTTRILEFREMVQGLNTAGLRVVMDVVYNHTNASGQAQKSVLDKIVPGYYHRLDGNGVVATSTCCANTATEHAMMEKLMLDSLTTWATEYKIDGFRFDLMGHHMVSNMIAVSNTLKAINPDIYIYGEGWNFGEVADNARGENATQLNLPGTGIGTFNDRLRDAVRGGGPFDGGDSLITNQGFISGLYYDPNATVIASGIATATQKQDLLLSADQIRVGLAGNLADYEFTGYEGATVKGSEVDYNGSPAGYTQDPQEHIIYVEAHDNQTLFDTSQYKIPTTTVMADRVRIQNLGIDLTALSQGVPFFHAGMDMLRSKSFDGNSFNSGDWFNMLDFSYNSTRWGVGLPLQGNNGSNWPQMIPMLNNANITPNNAAISNTVLHMQEMLKIRQSSPLFRLQTEQQVMDRLTFQNVGPDQIPGLIVMTLSDKAPLANLDPTYQQIVVLFNANDEAQTISNAAWQGQALTLHPIQAAGHDPVVKTATFTSGTGAFTIPARTTAVFVQQ